MRPGSSGKASLSHFCSASERLENGFPSGSCPSRTQRYSDLPASLFRNKDQRMYRSDLRRATIRPLPSANRGETPERTGFHITARRTRLVGAPARNAVRRAKKTAMLRKSQHRRNYVFRTQKPSSIARSASRLSSLLPRRAYLA